MSGSFASTSPPATERQGLLASAPGADDDEMEKRAKDAGQSKEDYNAWIAGGKMINHLMDKDHNECGMNPSIYDAAFVIPQICRSANWPRSLLNITIRSYFFLLVNFFFQLFILYMIAQEEEVMDKFAGQMSLCNFGANVHTCPGGRDCIGPAGTNYQNAGRMYDYASWSTRTFTRDSLKLIFPDQVHEINDKIDPGEYGVENFWVRHVCVFIFMMSVMSDLRSTMDMGYILWYVPSTDQPWIDYQVPAWAPKQTVKDVKECSELDFIKFKIAGMSKMWKIINLCVIILPKLFIWKKTAKYGVMFLMETAGIENVIVNVTALTFILNLDEMLFANFSHKALHHILEMLEPWSIQSQEHKEGLTIEQTYETVLEDRKLSCFSWALFPARLFATIFFTGIFVGEYFWAKCQFNEQGGLVSRPQYLPKDQIFPLLSFAFPFTHPEKEAEPYWSPAN